MCAPLPFSQRASRLLLSGRVVKCTVVSSLVPSMYGSGDGGGHSLRRPVLCTVKYRLLTTAMHCCGLCRLSGGRKLWLLRAVLIELFLTRKSGKAGNISKIWKFDRGQSVWKASHSNILKKNWKNIEKLRIKNCVILFLEI